MRFTKCFVCVQVLLFILFSLCYSGWVSLDGTDAPKSPRINVVFSNYDSTIISVTVPGFYAYDSTVCGVTYKRILLPNTGTTRIVGDPQLPIIYRFVGVPPEGDINISAESYRDSSFYPWTVFPLQDIVDTTDIFFINYATYCSVLTYHENLVYYNGPGFMRNIRVKGLLISPFFYDIKMNSVTVSCSMRIKLTYEELMRRVLTPPHTYKVSKPFVPVFRYSIINFEYLDIEILYNHSPFLIITLNDFLENENLCSFLKWKHKKGINLSFITYDYPPDTSSVIRNDILAFIDSTSELPNNILLIGSPDDIPVGMEPNDPPVRWLSDAFYSFKDSIHVDFIPDMPIGRFSIENIEQLQTVISKTYCYERRIDPNWNPNKYLFVANLDLVGGDTLKFIDAKKFIEDSLEGITSLEIRHAYANDPNICLDSISAPINFSSGVGIVDYINHGNVLGWPNLCPYPEYCGWMNTQIDEELDSTNFAPIMLSFCCKSGRFYDTTFPTCYTEKWVNTPYKGGAAAYGAVEASYSYTERDTTSGEVIGLLGSSLIDLRIFSLVHHYNSFHLGPTILGSSYLPDSLYNDIWERYCLIGDPSLDIWTAIEGSLKVTGFPAQLPTDTSLTLNLSITDEFFSSVDSAKVCLWKGEFDPTIPTFNDDYYEVKLADISGNVSFELTSSELYNPGILYVTATKHNYIPFEGQIIIGVAVVLQTNFGEGNIEVDQKNYPVPCTLIWKAGQNYNISADSLQFENECSRYYFTDWSDEGTRTHNVSVTKDTLFTANYLKQFKFGVEKEPPQNYGWIKLNSTLYDSSWAISYWGFEDSSYQITVSDTDGGHYVFDFWDEGRITDTSRTVNISDCTTYVAHYYIEDINLEITASPTFWNLYIMEVGQTIIMDPREMITIQNIGDCIIDLGLQIESIIDTSTGDHVSWESSYFAGENVFVLLGIFNDETTAPETFDVHSDVIEDELIWASINIFGSGGFNISESDSEHLWLQFLSPTMSYVYEIPVCITLCINGKVNLP